MDAAACELAYDMAYGLSHELNNPLANIAARARLLAESEPDAARRRTLVSIVDQAMRGCEMIADLMLLARPPQITPQRIDLLELIDGIFKSSRPWAERRNIELSFTSFDSRKDGAPRNQSESGSPVERPVIMADRDTASEAIWAVLRNAIEASRNQVCLRVTATSASTVELIIEDDGPGLTDEAMLRAFHPYYSGREAGRGLGLGLSKAQRFMQLAGGYVTIHNRSREATPQRNTRLDAPEITAGQGCIARLVWPIARLAAE